MFARGTTRAGGVAEGVEAGLEAVLTEASFSLSDELH